MALHFITGASGAGKSHYIYKKIIEAAVNDRQGRFFVLVPEQYTMQTQKELTRLHPEHCILNIDVLSFNRLAYRVFGDIGKGGTPILEDMGKLLVLQKIIWNRKSELKILGRTLDTPGSVEQMKSLISELKQYCIGPDELCGAAEKDRLLAAKAQDVALIYRSFEEYIENKYLTAEDVPEILSRVIDQSDYLKGSTIVLDGFTGFVPAQLHLMEKILGLAKDVYCVVTFDEAQKLRRKSRPTELFHMSHQLCDSLITAARSAGCQIEEPVHIGGENGRFAGREELAFLERNLFRYKAAKYNGAPDRIRVTECADTEEEIDVVISRILRDVREKGRRFSDFAIVSGALDDVGKTVMNRLAESGIPAFLDKKVPLSANPFIEFICGAVEMITENYSYAAVMRFLRSTLAGFSQEETDRFENYILAFGIKGRKKYYSEWNRTSKRFNEAAAAEADALRERFTELVGPFGEVFSRRMTTVREKTEALYGLILRCGVQKKLKEMEEMFGAVNDSVRRSEYAQIYKVIMDLFSKLVDILGDEKVGNALYQQLTETAVTSLQLGIIPGSQDQVTVGDIERSRIRNIKTLFFIGVNDGVIPKNASKAGLLSDPDREAFSEAGLVLSPGPEEEMYRQRFYLYLNLTIASEEVRLSYHRTGSDGRAAMPSYFINTILKLFPELGTESAAAAMGRFGRFESRPGRENEFIKALRRERLGLPDVVFGELYRRMTADPGERRMAELMLEASEMKCPKTDISPAAASALYSPAYSVTRLESYADCAFKHFCSYGLRLNERDIYEFTAADFGTIMHNALMRFSFLMQDRDRSWRNTDDAHVKAYINEALDSYLNDSGGMIIQESSRTQAVAERMRGMLEFSAWVLTEQVRRGSFTPEEFERSYRIGDLKGTIDRLDVCDAGGAKYIRVIDYKTGSAELDIPALLHGHCLQLPVYMIAAKNIVSGGVPVYPAGIYYYKLDDPVITVSSLEENVDDESLLKKMRLKGLSRSEQEIIPLIDGTISPENAESGVVEITLKKTGEPTQRSKVADGDNFGLIERFTGKKVKGMQKAIESGDARIDPILYGSRSAGKDGCSYCPYRGVCGYDERVPGYRHKLFKERSAEDALIIMSSEIAKKGDE